MSVILDIDIKGKISISGYESILRNDQELIDRTLIKTKNGSMSLKLHKEILEGKSKLFFTLLSIKEGRFSVLSGGKTLANGEFEKPDNTIFGAVRCVVVDVDKIFNGEIKVELDGLEEIAIREFCLL